MSKGSDTSTPKLSVLLVDDDENLLTSTTALLSDEFDVTCAVDARAALELLKGRDFDVVCADYRMPGMSGVELLRSLDSGKMGRVLITGNRDFFEGNERCAPGEFKVVFKPYRLDRLTQALEFEANRIRMLNAAMQLKELRERRGGSSPEDT